MTRRAATAALVALLVAGPLVVAASPASATSEQWSCTTTAVSCTWTVPPDVYGTATLVVAGARGGGPNGSGTDEVGGAGAVVSATLGLTADTTVTAFVGSAGTGPAGSAPGVGGSAPSGSPPGLAGGPGGLSQYQAGGGGGAASAVEIGGSLLAVAGGGGGAGGAGVDDPTPVTAGGDGGTPFLDGGNGEAGGGCNGGSQGGAGGSAGSGGAGSGAGPICYGVAASGGANGGSWDVPGSRGGSGGMAPNSDGGGHAGGGGGGGGGGFGAGGGAGAASGAASGGGGGAGGSFTATSLSQVSEQGSNTGNGYVTITYQTGTAPVFAGPLSANVTAGSTISLQIGASGEPPPTFSETGALPSGVELSSSGTLAGTLPAGSAGAWSFQVSAANSVSSTSGDYLLQVGEPAGFSGQLAVAAGTGSAGTSPDGTPALSGQLDQPVAVAVDAAGDRFVLDSASSSLEEIPAASATSFGISMTAGDLYDIAGDGVAGDAGDAGPGPGARLDHPSALALDAYGDVFIADTGNDAIRVLAARNGCLLGQQMTAGDLYTVAGTLSMPGYHGDGGPATRALLDSPAGVAVDPAGDVFIADSGNNVIREVAATPSCGAVAGIVTLLGSATAGSLTSGASFAAARLDDPTSLAVGPDGNLYLADSGADVVAVAALSSASVFGAGVVAAHVYTVAGDGAAGDSGNGGPAGAASLDEPAGLAFDVEGDLYLSDAPAGDVRVVAGSATTLYGLALSTGDIYQAVSGLGDPGGLAVDRSGALFVAQPSSEEVGVLGVAPSFTSAASDSMQAGAAGSFTVSASGEPPPSFSESGALPQGVTLSSRGILSGTPALGSAGSYPVTLRASNGVGAVATQDFVLSIGPAPTTIAVALDPQAPAVAGHVTLDITVSPAPQAGSSVSVSDSAGWLSCPAAPLDPSSGRASCVSSSLRAIETDSVTVRFAGDAQEEASSASTSFTPTQAMTGVELAASPAVPEALSTATLSAQVSPVPDGGDVAFADADGYVDGCAEVAVSATGLATCTTGELTAAGADSVTARYLGDASYAASAIASLPLTIARAATTLGISTEPSPLVDEQTGVLVAAVAAPAGAVEDGEVGFSDTAGNVASGSCSSQPVAAGEASCRLPTVRASNDTVTAAYSGDSLYAPVTATATLSPTTRVAKIALSVSTGALETGLSSVVTASVDQPGAQGSVAFSDTSGLLKGCGAVGLSPEGTATCPTAPPSSDGTDEVTASYSGDANDSPASATVAVPVDTAPSLLSASSYTATAGSFFSESVSTSGVPPVSSIAVDGGLLPPGLALSAGSGGTATISGTVAAGGGGAYSVDVALGDGVLAPVVVPVAFDVGQAPAFATGSEGTCVAGSACDIAVSASGYPAPQLGLSGSLPAGLSFTDQGDGTGLISGTPSAAAVGSSSFVVSADNGIGSAVELHFTLAVAPAVTTGDGTTSGGGSPAASTLPDASPPPPSSANGSAAPAQGASALLVSYSVTASLSGALRQRLACSAPAGEVHVGAARGALSELGFSLPCSSGKLAALLAGSVTSRRAAVRLRAGSGTVKRLITRWEGGFRLVEPRRHLALTFAVARAAVNRNLVLSAIATSVLGSGNARRRYRLLVRLVPHYSAS